jgi:TPR repeat protein
MNYDNYCNLQVYLNEATKLLRNIFKKRWLVLFENSWNDTETDALFFSKNENGKKIRKILKEKKFQTSLEKGNSNEWDLTILATILLSKPFKTEQTECHIKALKEICSKVAHMVDMAISDELFNQLFENISQSMISLGYGNTGLNSLKIKLSYQKYSQINDDNSKLTTIVTQADEELSRKNYFESITLYSNAINLFDLSNNELADLYYKRSVVQAQLYDESNKPDEKYLYRALLDAEKVVAYQPNMTRGYIQNAELALKLNLLDKSEELYKKALAIDVGNKELKNSLAFVRSKKGQQDRKEHLDPKFQPLTTEENNEIFSKILKENQGVSIDTKEIEKLRKMMEELDPSKADVYLGHDYRDGSKKTKQSYEMAAKYYAKAAQKNNAEALYNLALLHMKGQGVKIDYPTAIGLLKQAADQPEFVTICGQKIENIGVKEAEHSLGLAYQQGTFVEKDNSIAAIWYERAVKHQNGDSANNLGLLYVGGDGVSQNLETAEKLFLLAHKLGNNHAVSNLVDLYLLKNDPDQALFWQLISLESGDLYSLTRNDQIIKDIESKKKLKNLITQNVINEKDLNYLQELSSFTNTWRVQNMTPQRLVTNISKYNPEMLSNYANKGSITAAKMLKAQRLFSQSLSMLENGDITSFINTMSEAYETESLVCLMPLHLKDESIKVLETFISKNEKNTLDCKARICLIYLCMNSIDFISVSLLKYPNTKTMLQLRGCVYGFENKCDQALDDLEAVLKIDPLCYEALYFKSSSLFQLKEYKKSIETFNQFLTIAPKDDRIIPKSYYLMALMELHLRKGSMIQNVQQLFNKGIESEKEQLPCFMPYECKEKEFLTLLFKIPEIKQPSDKRNENFASESHSMKIESIAKDYRRISLIVEHRENHKHLIDMKKTNMPNIVTSKCPLKKQSVESIIGLKAIFLRDIDFTKDHVIKSCVLTLKVIEIPNIIKSTMFVAVDDYDIAERVAIYNLKENNDRIEEMFEIGCRFSIINPYIRMALDGKYFKKIYK